MLALLLLASLKGVADASFVSEVTDGCGYMVKTAVDPGSEVKKLAKDASDFEKFPDKSKLPQKTFTWGEVAKCDGEQGRPMHLVIDNNVYDFTVFADLHPAGPEPLKKHAGHDASAAMRASKMPSAVLDVFIHRFKVGTIDQHHKMGEAQYRLAEVQARNGKLGAPIWMVYKDSVYDVTSYINEHPGGYDTIIDEAGRDATKAFQDAGHSGDATTILKKYKIGEIVEEEKKYDANGKKKKKVVDAKPEATSGRSCLSIVTCGLVG